MDFENEVLKNVKKLCFGQKMEKVGKFFYLYTKFDFLEPLKSGEYFSLYRYREHCLFPEFEYSEKIPIFG